MIEANEVLHNLINLTVELDKSDGITATMVVDEMQRLIKSYAMQEVKKHLEIAANEALSDSPYHEVDKESITNIQINLT